MLAVLGRPAPPQGGEGRGLPVAAARLGHAVTRVHPPTGVHTLLRCVQGHAALCTRSSTHAHVATRQHTRVHSPLCVHSQSVPRSTLWGCDCADTRV